MIRNSSYLQLGFSLLFFLNYFLHLCKLIVIVHLLRVEQCSGWFDDLARHDLLDRQLNFFEVDRCLRAEWLIRLEAVGFCEIETYWDISCLKGVLWHMPRTRLLLYGRFYLLY